MPARFRSFARGSGLFTAGLLVGLMAGAMLSAAVAADAELRYQGLAVFAEALHRIEHDHVLPHGSDALLEFALRGMVDQLDPYSQYLSGQEYRELRDETRGRYFGVGIVVDTDMEGRRLRIRRVLPDAPAARAGLLPGDEIVSVDGRAVDQEPYEALGAIRGPKGTVVRLGIRRETWDEEREIPLERSRIRTEAVEVSRQGGVAIVALEQFTENAARDLGRSLARLDREQGVTGLVLDLRSNPGGLLGEAVAVVDLFEGSAVVVTTCGRDNVLARSHSRAPTPWGELPVAVLIDRSSASASEIVAAAFQDLGRGPVIGERSYGKGSVQQVYGLGDQSALKLTVARYLPPSGRSIEGEGVLPDVARSARPDASGSDESLEEALRYLGDPGAYTEWTRGAPPAAFPPAEEQCRALHAGAEDAPAASG